MQDLHVLKSMSYVIEMEQGMAEAAGFNGKGPRLRHSPSARYFGVHCILMGEIEGRRGRDRLHGKTLSPTDHESLFAEADFLCREAAYFCFNNLPAKLFPELFLVDFELERLDGIDKDGRNARVIPSEKVFTGCDIDLSEDEGHLAMNFLNHLQRLFTEVTPFLYVRFNLDFHRYVTPVS